MESRCAVCLGAAARGAAWAAILTCRPGVAASGVPALHFVPRSPESGSQAGGDPEDLHTLRRRQRRWPARRWEGGSTGRALGEATPWAAAGLHLTDGETEAQRPSSEKVALKLVGT